MASVYDFNVQCGSCGDIVEATPPKSKRTFSLASAFLLGTIGMFLGLSVGVATAGFGMAATPFTLVIGLYVGYRIGVWSAEKKDGLGCPECDSHIANS
ncbi:hypothetical protein [Haloarcula nitratireducens]|uniref:Uncharacterized protein n=1 Tax=Haloarcula nitratireducens TaxID=2487749 RepID=A0AAW4PKH4_9EURY|nr:hypothetical protein [Halomicroarcula nitratireducens]MBX0297865.1 hypothetical protein [Halomicroarcula nitratireducens]